MSQGTLPRDGDRIVEFLKPDKTIRDPVHGDIMVNHLETRIIDTRDFQRLRDHHQLGLVRMVYPGAIHTRFDHSLGTVAMAQYMVDRINANPYPGRPIKEPIETLLIRTCALLHDFVNVPFGHTLEDEGNLLVEDWSDNTRLERFLSPDTAVGHVLVQEMGEDFRALVVRTLKAKEDDEIARLPFPFISDIVGNTICADLLDYLARDNYFCGLNEQYDRRFLNYLFITEEAPNRLALRLWSKDRKRKDVLSETIKLLRTRYSLAEKVYFHHTKLALSAMLIEAVSDSLSQIKKDNILFTNGDEVLLNWLETNASPVSRLLASKIRCRDVYQPVYSVSYDAQAKSDERTQHKVRRLIETYRDPENRRALTKKLENWNVLPEGSVVVYCPDEEMNLKIAKAKIEWFGRKIMQLQEISDPIFSAEITGIQEQHRRLWQFLIFVDPKYVSSRLSRNLTADCQHEIGLRNEAIEEDYPYVASPEERRIQLIREKLQETGESELTGEEIVRLLSTSRRYSSISDKRIPAGLLPPIDWYLKELKSIRG